jgi:hypothetical protein
MARSVIRVGPNVKDPTHHISLTDRNGRKVGIILCDQQGRVSPAFDIVPVDRSALKTTSGTSSYSDMQYPYSPIVQDNWSGGRGGLDFERDTTKFRDSYRMRTGKENKAFLGPQEQYTKGYRSQDYSVPGNVRYHTLTDTARTVGKRFQASASYTAVLAWLKMKRKGFPEDLRISICSDNAGLIDAELSYINVASTRLEDVLSEWLDEIMSQALTGTTHYWIVVQASADDDSENHWEVAVKNSSGTSYAGSTTSTDWEAASFDLYFRLSDADTDKSCIYFRSRRQQYKVISGTSGAPKLYMNGDRGAADANTGALTNLKDATKNWVTNEWAGCVVEFIAGPGFTEDQNYRTIVSNTATELVLDHACVIEHTTSTEYVIVGSAKWTEIGIGSYGGTHGLTAPITDVLVSTKDVIYFCMGDAVNIRRHREYNNAGTWTSSDWADDSTSKAIFMIYKPQAQKIVVANNSDASANVSSRTMSNASVPAWGTDLTWDSARPIGNNSERIQGLEIYPEDNGTEAVKVYKTERPWVLPGSGNPYPVNIKEMETMSSEKNGVAHLVHNVYEYFSLGNGLTRFYGGNFDDLGPNIGEGLPAGRRGNIVSMAGYPGKFFALIDGGSTGYSSVLVRENNGWHEHYRAPKGQRLSAAAFQPVPGTALNRLWLYQGNDSIWLPFPSEDINELNDSNYLYTDEGALHFSRMHAGMFDVQKLMRIIKLQTENLESGVCTILLDYRLDDTDEWTTIDETFDTSPTQAIDLINDYGLAAKRVELRARFSTTDASVSPILLALIIEAVLRISLKNMYPITFRVMDKEPSLQGERIPDPIRTLKAKLDQLNIWADDRSDSMLKMRCEDPMWHGKMVFLNFIESTLVTVEPDRERGETFQPYRVRVCRSSLQEA